MLAFAVQARGKKAMPAIEVYKKLSEGSCHCDYSFHCIITDPTEELVKEELPKMIEQGITSVKVGAPSLAQELIGKAELS